MTCVPPFYTGRKRGQVVRTRTIISQAHSFHWLGSFGNRGNGRYREELRQGLSAIGRYLTAHQFPPAHALLRLDGQYGTGAVLSDLAGFAFVTRGKDYTVLDHPLVQAQRAPASRSVPTAPGKPDRAQPLRLSRSAGWLRGRVVSRGGSDPSRKPQEESGWRDPFGCCLRTLLHEPARAGHSPLLTSLKCICIAGPYAPQQASEDQEIDPDRWCSHSAWGQECWQIVAQWVWNLRLELGHVLKPEPLRTTEFAPASCESHEPQSCTCGYGKPAVAAPWKAGRFSGQDFALQSDGTLRCPAHQTLSVHERRKEVDGSLRLVYAARIRSCRPCPLREQCQWSGAATAKPRQVSVLLHPVVVGSSPLLWRDWRRREHRRACIQLLRHQRVEVQVQSAGAPLTGPPAPLSRAERAHSRLNWEQRLARNVQTLTSGQVTIQLFGVPEHFATALGLASA